MKDFDKNITENKKQSKFLSVKLHIVWKFVNEVQSIVQLERS